MCKVPKLGDMVLINDENHSPRVQWKRGVIKELFFGKDGQVRGVALTVFRDGKYSVLRRPVQRLVPFEIVESEENPKEVAITRKYSETEVVDADNKLPHEKQDKRPKRNAAVVADIKRKLGENKYF